MRSLLCFDIGGSQSRRGIIDVRGPEDFQLRDGTYRDGLPAPARADNLAELARDALRDVERCDGIACAIAASVRDHRYIRESPNVPFVQGRRDVDLGGWFYQQLGYAAWVSNDMEAALAGEVLKGALQGCRWAFMDTISTGWGGAMLYGGVEVAAEPGHIVAPNPTLPQVETLKCSCGREQCAEARYSGGGVRRRVREMARELAFSIPADVDPCAFADQEAAAGKNWAVALYSDVARGIGEIWGSRLNLCPPVEKIVYMGTFAQRTMALPFFAAIVRRVMLERSLFRDQHEGISIVSASAPHGPLYGAAKIFLRESGDVP